MHERAGFADAAHAREGGEGVALPEVGIGGVLRGLGDGGQPFRAVAVAFEGVGDEGVLFGGGAAEAVFFEDFVQADAGLRALGEVEDVVCGRCGGCAFGERQAFGVVEGGLHFVGGFVLRAAVGKAAGEAGEAGVADNSKRRGGYSAARYSLVRGRLGRRTAAGGAPSCHNTAFAGAASIQSSQFWRSRAAGFSTLAQAV